MHAHGNLISSREATLLPGCICPSIFKKFDHLFIYTRWNCRIEPGMKIPLTECDKLISVQLYYDYFDLPILTKIVKVE